jgi:hypothetical protein
MNLDRKKTFRLFVETGATDGPEDRWYRTLRAALRGFEGLDDDWKPDAWIIEYHEQPSFGGIQVVRNIVHMRYGERVEELEDERGDEA